MKAVCVRMKLDETQPCLSNELKSLAIRGNAVARIVWSRAMRRMDRRMEPNTMASFSAVAGRDNARVSENDGREEEPSFHSLPRRISDGSCCRPPAGAALGSVVAGNGAGAESLAPWPKEDVEVEALRSILVSESSVGAGDVGRVIVGVSSRMRAAS